MKLLLTALNAKYIHSNPAVYSLRAYALAKDPALAEHIEIAEYTINQEPDEILRSIYEKKPDVIAFSCYIWNIRLIAGIIVDLKKVLPDAAIWLGGPEVSFDAKERLAKWPGIYGIMRGEGEETFYELAESLLSGRALGDIRGITYRNENTEQIVETEAREALRLSDIPFPYEDPDDFENRIIYYETSRGCPYSCSYCLSSVEKHVRLRSMELVKRELAFFLDHKVKQVKFVDRTFNCNKEHAAEIWGYLREHDNGITNFHFEISADIIDETELSLLKNLRPGLIQLEIGVQSTNPDTIRAIRRRMDVQKLKAVTERIRSFHNIHQHLDLIAGLPYEDYHSFQKSFQDVYEMSPNQLQLGFLKVLKGAAMEDEAAGFGIEYHSEPPYEVLFTKWLSFSDVLRLKGVEEMLEIYYNSGQFTWSVRYLENYFSSPFLLYEALASFYQKKGIASLRLSRLERYRLLCEFGVMLIMEQKNTKISIRKEGAANGTAANGTKVNGTAANVSASTEMAAFKEILYFDYCRRERPKSSPDFAAGQEAYKKYRKAFYESREKELKTHTYLHHFDYSVRLTALNGRASEDESYILFDYDKRDPMDFGAEVTFYRKDGTDRFLEKSRER